MKKILLLILLLLLSGSIFSKGKWEVGVHYSYWTINVAKPFFEEAVGDAFDNFDSSKGDIIFDSNGNNYGVDIRYYPAGKYGSFSLGFSYERNNFKGDLTGTYADTDKYGNRAEIEAIGFFDLKPHSFNFSFRWDIVSKYRVHPFFGIGFGIGKIDGLVNLTTTTKTYINDNVIIDEDIEEKTLSTLIEEYEEDDGEKFPLGFFPIVYITFGIKGEITDNIYFLGEIAVYDGLIFRGGVAFKF